MFTNKNTTYKNLNDFNGKIFSVVKSFSEKKILEEFYPEIHLLMVDDNNETFKQLSFNKVDATINNLGVGYEVISKNCLTNIVPSFEIKDKKFNIDLRLVVNKENPLLRNILNKVQNIITKSEMKVIKDKWLIEKHLYEDYKVNYLYIKYILRQFKFKVQHL